MSKEHPYHRTHSDQHPEYEPMMAQLQAQFATHAVNGVTATTTGRACVLRPRELHPAARGLSRGGRLAF